MDEEKQPLNKPKILVAEDETVLAMEIADALLEHGYAVVGPVSQVEEVAQIARSGSEIDWAVLDVNLRGQFVFAAAELLVARGVPILFATGYEDTLLFPHTLRHHPRLDKPYTLAELLGFAPKGTRR
jgi:CheY-like chemotaxis protein